jgi:NADH dehydrogenase (ubiquinone) 1 alpha subcomplex subunit 5
MRPAVRFLAAVQRALEPGSPTGLTGLTTHPAPRSTLIYLYSSTLSKLKQIPESSVYRQSTEALTKQRLSIVEAAKPPGYDAWADTVSFRIAKHQEALAKDGKAENLKYEDREFFFAKMGEQEVDEREVEWDGEPVEPPGLEGPRTLEEQERNPAITGALRGKGGVGEEIKRAKLSLEQEPMLTMDQYVAIITLSKVV